MVVKFTAQKFVLRALLHKPEDSFGSYTYNDEQKIMVVGDGVTRDPCLKLPDTSTDLGKLLFLSRYPRMSPARIASEIFVREFKKTMIETRPKDRDERAIREGFRRANEEIERWNKRNIPNPDYLVDDFAGCVGSGLSYYNGVLTYGFISDCGIAVYDSQGNLKFKTDDDGPSKYDEAMTKNLKIRGLTWRDSEFRRTIRRDFRNKPDSPNSYGVLTGEREAMTYVHNGRIEVRPREHIAVFSDGLVDIIQSGEFIDMLKQGNFSGMEKVCKKRVKTEGTLVYSRV